MLAHQCSATFCRYQLLFHNRPSKQFSALFVCLMYEHLRVSLLRVFVYVCLWVLVVCWGSLFRRSMYVFFPFIVRSFSFCFSFYFIFTYVFVLFSSFAFFCCCCCCCCCVCCSFRLCFIRVHVSLYIALFRRRFTQMVYTHWKKKEHREWIEIFARSRDESNNLVFVLKRIWSDTFFCSSWILQKEEMATVTREK